MKTTKSHHHHHEVSGKNLGRTIILNLIITIAEAVGGLLSGSMALLSDAAHNLSDVVSLLISYVANRLAKRKAGVKQTFGYKRAEIFAAFINSAALIVLAGSIIILSFRRVLSQPEISAEWVIYLSLLSIVVNALSVLLIRKDARENMNMKTAYLHLFSDMLTSVAVLIGGLAMKYFQWYWIDSVFSIIIAFYLLFLSWKILKASLKIMMQFTPHGIDLQKVVQRLLLIPGVKNFHHVHVWQINDHQIMFEAHVDLNHDCSIGEFEKILNQIESTLNAFEITHCTIQPEYGVNDNKEIVNCKL